MTSLYSTGRCRGSPCSRSKAVSSCSRLLHGMRRLWAGDSGTPAAPCHPSPPSQGSTPVVAHPGLPSPERSACCPRCMALALLWDVDQHCSTVRAVDPSILEECCMIERKDIKKVYLRLLSCFANCTFRTSASFSLAMLLPESVFQKALACLDEYMIRSQS